MNTNTRKFTINGTAYEAKKSMFAGHSQFNAKGEWIFFWYVKPVSLADSQNNWEPVGRTLSNLNNWIKRQGNQS